MTVARAIFALEEKNAQQRMEDPPFACKSIAVFQKINLTQFERKLYHCVNSRFSEEICTNIEDN